MKKSVLVENEYLALTSKISAVVCDDASKNGICPLLIKSRMTGPAHQNKKTSLLDVPPSNEKRPIKL